MEQFDVEGRPRGSDDSWAFCSEPSWALNWEYRRKPTEPEWMPKPGDLIFPYSDSGDEEYNLVTTARFIRYESGFKFPYITSIGDFKYAKPHPLQVRHDQYKKVLEKWEDCGHAEISTDAREALEETE